MIKQETKKVKKGINKKLLSFVLLGIFVVALVSALTYYAMFSVTFTIHQPITGLGEHSETLGTFEVGEPIIGSPITVSNDGTTEKTVVISNDNVNPNVTVSYIGNLVMTQKNLISWVPEGNSVTVNYTMVGDTFKVSGVPTGYVVVYYPNTVSYAHYDGVVVLANDVATNLPVVSDLNGGVLSDYCINTFNPDATQCVGAKLWLVPVGAVTSNVIDWSQASSFYFETALIQFNSAGNIVISPGSSVTFTPMFEVDEHASDWTGTITTTIA